MRIPQRRITARLRSPITGEMMVINEAGSEPQLEADFSCDITTTPEANHATLRLYNLSKRSRDAIAGDIRQSIDATVELIDGSQEQLDAIAGTSINAAQTIRQGDMLVEVEYGHESTQIVFVGSCQWARHVKSGPTWVTEMRIGDALATMMRGVAIRTFPAGTFVEDIIRYLGNTMALDMAYLTAATFASAVGAGKTTIADAYTSFGMCREQITAFLAPLGAEWWVDRGEFFLAKRGQPLPEAPTILNYDSGLLSQPEPIESGGFRAISQCRPDIRVGRQLTIDGVDYGGTFRVESLSHRATNRIGDATTELFMRGL